MHALKVLEFEFVRGALAEECATELARALADELLPSFDDAEVWRLQGLTRQASALLDRDPPPSLHAVRDLRRECIKAEKGGTLGGETLYKIGAALSSMRAFRTAVRSRKEEAPDLAMLADALPELPQTESKLLESLDGDGEVLDAASTELTRLRRLKASTAQRIAERIQSYTTGRNRDWLSDPIYTQRDGRYVIPLKAEHRGKIKGVVHDRSSTGATLFIEPEDVLQLGNALREAEAAERAEVERVLKALSERVGRDGSTIAGGIEVAAQLDLTLAKAYLGEKMNAVAPERSSSPMIELSKARHPMLDPKQAVPLDLTVGRDFDGLLITGPNTGGKTVSIKTVGLLALMAQAGLMVPALFMRLGTFSQVWADIGDEQSLSQSLSTFSGHVKNIAKAVRELRPGALVLLDEIGAGTDPAEGAAFAKAVLLNLQKGGAKIVASTHYGELKVFAYNTPGFSNAAMEFDLKSLRPTYKLILGAPGASHALNIAERCGMPRQVIDLAREQHGEQQEDVARMLEKLETAQKQAQRAQGEADRLAASLRKVERETERKLAEADERRREARAKAAEAVEGTLRELRLEAAAIFERLKKQGVSAPALDEARTKLRDLQQVGGELAAELKPEPKARPRPASAQAIKKGDAVRIQGYTQVGRVLDDPKGDKVRVEVGMLKMSVPLAQLQAADVTPDKPKAAARQSLTLQKAISSSMELHLRHMRAEDAERELERFIDDAVLAGFPSVRIVHGKGEGILRKIVQSYLRKHKGVQSYRDANPDEGGQGVTIAVMG